MAAGWVLGERKRGDTILARNISGILQTRQIG
jgi:hypothetical protein